MKLKITIPADLPEMADKYLKEAYKALEQVGMAAYHEWQDEANRRLTRTKTAYFNSIQQKLESPGKMRLFLDSADGTESKLANMLEGGCPSFAIWRAIIRNAKVKPQIKKKERKRPPWAFHGPSGASVWVDVPLYPPGARRGTPMAYRRLTDRNLWKAPNRWYHPGFKPKGKGGLDAPLSEHVVKYVVEEAPEIFRKAMARVKV